MFRLKCNFLKKMFHKMQLLFGGSFWKGSFWDNQKYYRYRITSLCLVAVSFYKVMVQSAMLEWTMANMKDQQQLVLLFQGLILYYWQSLNSYHRHPTWDQRDLFPFFFLLEDCENLDLFSIVGQGWVYQWEYLVWSPEQRVPLLLTMLYGLLWATENYCMK